MYMMLRYLPRVVDAAYLEEVEASGEKAAAATGEEQPRSLGSASVGSGLSHGYHGTNWVRPPHPFPSASTGGAKRSGAQDDEA
ncbi:hypothetical protein L2E82_24952 [Cichorium intybus]|uniref:Uncharacterized protein n=1 Tax=Cichorium intybus TaxID=13427 RepID=A0ACB9E2A7_CICIN|nr:hypothetical protein L2E82_24952 [Cichorium intybus]